MKATQFYFILIILFITHGTCYMMGRNAESREYENEIDLSMEASYQTYINSEENDTSKFDYYGNKRTETDTTRRVLPKNSRTESHIPAATKNKDISQTRKRN